jgi:hypothetical protein
MKKEGREKGKGGALSSLWKRKQGQIDLTSGIFGQT